MPDASEERSVFSTSEFGTGKGLLIKKAQLEKTGHLILLKRLWNSGVFYCQGKGEGTRQGMGVSLIQVGVRKRFKLEFLNAFVLGWSLIAEDLSSVLETPVNL